MDADRCRGARDGGAQASGTAGAYGLSEPHAYQLVSQAGEAPLANVCDTNYTCVAKIRKEWLPPGEPHRALHRHLRDTVAALTHL